MSRRRQKLPLFLLPVLLLIGRPADPAGAAPPPNILVILTDDLGFGDLSSQGAGDLRTPHIDSLAATGMRWNNFYASCTVCSPTRAALMTGRFPDLVGVPGVIRTHADDNWGYFRPNGPTLPEQLRKAGYRTGLVGKWHLGLESPNTPTERGFEHFLGFLGDMMDDYWSHRRHGNNYLRHNREEIDPEGHATDLFSNWAAEFIRRERSPERPWFLYLAYNAPHTPIQPPEEWLQRVRQREPALPDRRARLVALIEHLDDGIGRVLAALEETGQRSNTLVVFSSDNGGQLGAGANNGPWRGGKQDAYEGGLRVPFFAAWPGTIAPGSHCDALALTMDLYPTLCDVAGITINHVIDGRSMLPSLRDGSRPMPDRALYWPRREGNNRYQGQDYYAVRSGEWKLLHNNPYEPLELYHLTEDPRESTNLAKAHPAKFNELGALLRRQIQRAGSVPWQRREGER